MEEEDPEDELANRLALGPINKIQTVYHKRNDDVSAHFRNFTR